MKPITDLSDFNNESGTLPKINQSQKQLRTDRRVKNEDKLSKIIKDGKRLTITRPKEKMLLLKDHYMQKLDTNLKPP